MQQYSNSSPPTLSLFVNVAQDGQGQGQCYRWWSNRGYLPRKWFGVRHEQTRQSRSSSNEWKTVDHADRAGAALTSGRQWIMCWPNRDKWRHLPLNTKRLITAHFKQNSTFLIPPHNWSSGPITSNNWSAAGNWWLRDKLCRRRMKPNCLSIDHINGWNYCGLQTGEASCYAAQKDDEQVSKSILHLNRIFKIKCRCDNM